MTDWSSLKVVDLRSELTNRGLPTKGVKAELIERLHQADLNAAQTIQEPKADDSALVDEANNTNDDGAAPEETSATAPAIELSPVTAATLTTHENATAQASTSTSLEPAVAEINTAQPEAGAESDLPTPLASSDAATEMQKRKRRSSTPPPSAKRARQEEERQAEQHEDIVDFETGDLSSSPDKKSPNSTAQRHEPSNTEHSKSKEEDVVDITTTEPQAPVAAREASAIAEPIVTDEPPRTPHPVAEVQMQDAPLKVTLEDLPASAVPTEGLPNAAQTTSEQQDALYDNCETKTSQPAHASTAATLEVGYDESASLPSEHPPTNSLYIRELMRPLKAEMVEQYILDLLTPPGGEPDPELINEFYLDQIRTHAFVQLASAAAAQRVRAALHDQIWPNERNRKPLWVDFIPSTEVQAWIERETSAPRGGQRWEVVYEKDGATVVAIHREAGSDNRPFSKPPPTGPATTGSVYPGIEAAPRGPRGPRGRGGRAAFESFNGSQNQQTQVQPSLTYVPQSEDIARSRIQNMRSFYSRDPPADLGKDYHRFTFENVDSFVNRGREVFIGIRPPHRQREHEERLHRERLGMPGDSHRNDQRAPPRPPVTDEDRFSRFDGGRRPDRPPRNRGFRGPGRFRGEDPYRYRPGY